MSKKRMIDTRFWADNWVRKLNALDRYLFLYLMSNDKCSFCGIYELPVSIMAFESGIDERDLEKTMLPRLEPKVYYYNGWVYMPNFKKHHVSEKSANSVLGYERALSEVPSDILEYFTKIDSPSKPLISPSDTIASAIASALNTAEQSSAEQLTIIQIIDEFVKFNPSCKKMYGNTTQRKAILRLVAEHGQEQLLKVIHLLPQTNTMAFFPTVTTPVQLEDKWASLESAFKKKKSEIKSVNDKKGHVYY